MIRINSYELIVFVHFCVFNAIICCRKMQQSHTKSIIIIIIIIIIIRLYCEHCIDVAYCYKCHT